MRPKNQLETCQYGKRTITVVNGIAFYQSTGENSSYKGTWFPFFGIDTSWEREGWIIKPSGAIVLDAMRRNDTIYFVSSNTNIDEITWDQVSSENKKSVLLLQCTSGGTLKARYVSPEYRNSRSFTYGENPAIQNSYDTLFEQKTLLSLNDIETILTNRQEKSGRTYNTLFKSIQNLHTTFFNSIFKDMRLHTLPIILGEVHEGVLYDAKEPDINPAERFLNLPMFEISNKFDKARKIDEELSVFFGEKDAQETSLFIEDNATHFEHRTTRGMEEVNRWILNQGGLVLPRDCDPLTLFKKSMAFDHWVLQQQLNRNNLKNIFDVLKSLGIPDKEIKRSMKRADIFIEAEIKKLVHHICKEIAERKRYDHRLNVDNILLQQQLDPFIKAPERADLQKLIEDTTQSVFKYDSLADRLIQFFKGLFKLDRASILTNDLNIRFMPIRVSEQAFSFFEKEGTMGTTDGAKQTSSTVFKLT